MNNCYYCLSPLVVGIEDTGKIKRFVCKDCMRRKPKKEKPFATMYSKGEEDIDWDYVERIRGEA